MMAIIIIQKIVRKRTISYLLDGEMKELDGLFRIRGRRMSIDCITPILETMSLRRISKNTIRLVL